MIFSGSLPQTLWGEQTGADRCFPCFFSSQRQKNEDCALIKAEENNDPTEIASRHDLSQETNMGTTPWLLHLFPLYSLSISCPHLIPLLPSSSLFLCSLPHCTLLLSIPRCVCVWGALSACWLPGYQSNWGVSREFLLSEPEPSVTALILSPFSLHLLFLLALKPSELPLTIIFFVTINSYNLVDVNYFLLTYPLSCLTSESETPFWFLFFYFCYYFISAFPLLSPLALWWHFSLAIHCFLLLHLAFIYHEALQEIFILLHNWSLTHRSTNPPTWHADTNI